MTWKMSYNLSSEKYAPLQLGKLVNVELTNMSDSRMVVTDVLLKFDWMGTYRWSHECNIKCNPGETVELPYVTFRIDLGAPTGSHHFEPGIRYKLLEEGEWISYEDTYVAHGDYIFIEPLPAKDYVVFVSHSNHKDDKKLIYACKRAMKACGITPYFAEETPRPGFRLWDKIAREIVAADAFLVLWTEHASRSGDVREEIGIAVGSGKLDKIVPIVEVGVDVVGSLKLRGIEWVDYNPPNHTKAQSNALGMIMEWAKEKEKKKAHRERARREKKVEKSDS